MRWPLEQWLLLLVFFLFENFMYYLLMVMLSNITNSDHSVIYMIATFILLCEVGKTILKLVGFALDFGNTSNSFSGYWTSASWAAACWAVPSWVLP